MEALILTVDVFCMTYLCWRLFKRRPQAPSDDDLGLFAYKPSNRQS